MTNGTIDILESALRYSLWVFLVLFSLAVCWVALRVHSRRRRRAAFESEESGSLLQASSQELGSAFKALALCVVLSVLFMIALLLAPFPFLHNFVTTDSWKLQPLRLTHLTLQRLEKGFVLEGEVYNQTEEPIEKLSGVVKIWGVDEQLLDEVPLEVRPAPLPALQAGRFKVRYTEEPVRLYGYEVVFLDADGLPISYTQGFDLPEGDEKQAPAPPK